MLDFKNKTVVITGAASGVGKHLALRFAKAGARIVLADIEQAALDVAVSEVRAMGAEAIGQVTDVVKRDQVDALRDRVLAEYGRVDLLFNNAGVGGGGGSTVWDTPEKAYRWAMDVNFFGPLNGILSFMPCLLAQNTESLIASTSSAAGIIFPPAAAAYSASKAALIALMEIVALQLQMGGSKVKAAILFPGPHVVDTNLFSSHRNVQQEYADPAIALGMGINNVDEFQVVMSAMLGRPVELTSPADFAEEVFQALQRDEFYILPLTATTQDAVRKRYEIMLERGQPVIPDMF
jgi:NAD(P)-dependent dehydrogenase (short-subunit alcohol dehydrogenase family)